MSNALPAAPANTSQPGPGSTSIIPGVPLDLSHLAGVPISGMDRDQILNLLQSLPGNVLNATKNSDNNQETAAQILQSLANNGHSPLGVPFGPTPGHPDPGPSSHPRGPPTLNELQQEAAIKHQQQQQQQQGSQISGLEQYVGMAGQDLEELMIMEAMRLSLLEHETQQKKEEEENRKKAAAAAPAASESGTAAPASSSHAAPSVIEPVRQTSDQSSPHRSSSSLSAPQQPESHSRSSSLSRIFQRNKDHTAAQENSTHPPAFSTLNAALSTSSTASAIIRSTPEATTPSAASPAQATPTETPDAVSSSSGAPVLPPIDIPSAMADEVSLDETPDTSMTSANTGSDYDVLNSSTESVARKPLLHNESYLASTSGA